MGHESPPQAKNFERSGREVWSWITIWTKSQKPVGFCKKLTKLDQIGFFGSPKTSRLQLKNQFSNSSNKPEKPSDKLVKLVSLSFSFKI
jgi:hypothetical protein